jgi:hypothetical protein
VQIAYIRGSQINFIVIPDMLQKAPFFNRIKLWRKYKGHAIMGASTPVEPGLRGQTALVVQKARMLQTQSTVSGNFPRPMGGYPPTPRGPLGGPLSSGR